MTEDKMVRWHHQLDGHGFGRTPGVGDRQGGLVCCGSCGHKDLDMTELKITADGDYAMKLKDAFFLKEKL